MLFFIVLSVACCVVVCFDILFSQHSCNTLCWVMCVCKQVSRWIWTRSGRRKQLFWRPASSRRLWLGESMSKEASLCLQSASARTNDTGTTHWTLIHLVYNDNSKPMIHIQCGYENLCIFKHIIFISKMNPQTTIVATFCYLLVRNRSAAGKSALVSDKFPVIEIVSSTGWLSLNWVSKI